MDTTSKLLPLKTAARALGVKEENLRAAAEAGQVPHTMLGSDFLFSLEAVESVLAERAAKQPASRKIELGEVADA